MRSYSSDHTYSLSDLENWDFDGTSLAVLGHPVQHSVSPQMHNAALAELAIQNRKFASWKYFKFDVEAVHLPLALPIFHEKGFIGLNLTIPHKEVALDSITQIDEHAKRIGAVNTLIRQDSGYKGYNTDGYGLSEGIRRKLDQSITQSNIVLLGAGGAARAAAIQCIEEHCSSLTIINRNQDRLQKLIDNIAPFAKSNNVPLIAQAPDESYQLAQHALLINATSLGLKVDDSLPFIAQGIPSSTKCFDMIYNPSTTKLMQLVEKTGGRSANGLSMLIHQGAKALEIWTDTTAPADTMSRAATNALTH